MANRTLARWNCYGPSNPLPKLCKFFAISFNVRQVAGIETLDVIDARIQSCDNQNLSPIVS